MPTGQVDAVLSDNKVQGGVSCNTWHVLTFAGYTLWSMSATFTSEAFRMT